MSAEALIADFEERTSRALGNALRRKAGVYYTPPALAAQVVELALRHGKGSVLDPCAGAGAFLLAAARAGVKDLRGVDLDAAALRVARKVVPQARLKRADSLRFDPEPADLLVSNPPYGHVADARERDWLLQRFPALRGGEIDRYAAFLLRSLELVRPGGAVALLVPDTWMFLHRAARLRAAVLEKADIAAVVDLGKPFASAKDTRVQAVVLLRRPARARSVYVGRGHDELSPSSREELSASARRGWFLYRTRGEKALCEAMERASVRLGDACTVGYGLRTGCNPRHVLRRAPSGSEIGLVGGEDIVPYGLRWRPKTLADADRLQPLVDRQLGKPRVAIQRIRTNSQAPWARWLEATMVGISGTPYATRHANSEVARGVAYGVPESPALVCLDSLSTLAAGSEDLLWALLAMVQSVPLQRYHRLRTTDVNVKPSALRELPVPRALLHDPRPLAALARSRANGAEVDRNIDAAVYRLFALDKTAVEACERGFWESRFDEQFQLLEQSMSGVPANVVRMEGTA